MAIITGDAGDNLLTGGAANDTIDGLAGNDTIHGGDGQDSLLGGLGNDYLDGDAGADTMVGGLGNDTYVVDNALDVVIEAAGEGVDLVYSAVDYTLTANVENLTLIAGSAAVIGTGNALDNEIDGNEANNTLSGLDGNDVLIGGAGQDSLVGGAGNDYLDGGTGADTMVGGLGNDTYVVDNALDVVIEAAGEGVDLVYSAVDYTLTANVDNLTLIAGSAAVIGTGNALDNDIIGNQNNNVLTGQAGNDYLDGGIGADTMTGGLGDDIYVVDNVLDTVIEASGEGYDTVSSTVDYTLGANVERLILAVGSAALLGTGNALDNFITGNEGNNILSGLDGNDKIDGGAGDDTILGGAGDDILDGLAGNDNMQGGDGHDVLEGGDGNDLEDGGAGDDSLWGEAGADTLMGGAGNDTYRFEVGNGIDTIIDTALPGEGNRILFGAGIVLSNLTFTQDPVARTLTIQVGVSGTDKLLLTNFDPTGANGSLVVQTLQFADLSVVNLLGLLGPPSSTSPTEGNDVLTGTPNDDVINALGGNDVINALGGNDVIDGGAGADTMFGGLGDDTYVVDNAGDVVTENANEGTDLVQSSVSYTLGANVENLTLTGTGAINGTGNSLNNILTGNSGVNVLTGGLGDDTYVVDNAGDVVTENANEGTDLVQSSVTYTLGANVENLTLTGTGAINGTGNSLNNILTGNSGVNVLTGGLGDDTYVVNNAGDVVTENANEGIDTVLSSVTYTLGANVENLTLTGTGAINGTGNSLNNILTGNSAANVLTGGSGVDTMLGGAGDDTYVVDNAGDVVTENANEGIDTVLSSVSYTLGANLENLTLTGTAVNGTGNELNNILTGVSGVANVLTGGAGDDTYVVGTGDTAVENANEGTDLVQSTVTYTLGANLENLTLIGTGAINGTGNSLNNVLTGNSAANVFTGGAGDDIYNVSTGDTAVENANEGTDLVQSDVSFTLGANVENLTLTGTAAINGTGNSLNNILTGNSAANVFTGGAGDDTYNVSTGDTVVEAANAGTDLVQSDVTYTLGANVENLTLTGTGAINGTGNSLNNILTGNSAANVFTGGAGDDTYNVSTGDTVVENANEGTDLVQSDVSFTLGANVENLTFTGTAAIDGTGNSLNNILTGNSAANVFTGGAGDDTYNVSTGDTAVENANEGTDLVQSTVTYTLGANLENLTLTGTAAIDGTGNSLNNILTGNSAANVFTGGAGDDTYNVSTGDTVVENANEGTDLVQSDVSWTLGANVENLTLMGTAAIDGTGNSLNNILTGNNGVNVLTGGLGDDTYNVSTGDVVVENANEGTDLVQSSVSYTLGANVENLTLTGTGAINGTGNSLNNILTGNNGVNVLTGGLGDDTYVVNNAGDVVTENANEGTDLVQSDVSFTLGANVENLTLTGTAAIDGTGNSLNNILTGNSAANVFTGGAGDDTYNVSTGDTVVEAANAGTDLVQSDVSWTLGANVENLTLTGTAAIDGTGNSLNNSFTGNSAANVFTGGAGDDTYNVSTGDTVVEAANAGTDLVLSSASFTLGANVENLTLTGTAAIDGTGNSLNNILTGNSAANVFTGGAGDDTYNVSTGDVVVENANEGTDLVQSDVSWTLGANVENLTLTGTAAIDGIGNSLNNVLTGNSATNVLIGGAGDDTYVVNNAGDVVTENANEGTDLVQSSVSWTLGANVENLTLTGTGAIDGIGNSLNNILTGNSAANLLIGGAGDDTYNVSTGDTVVEVAAEGTDLVQSDVSWTLGANVENLTLTGTGAIDGTGNSLNNSFTGNSAANVFTGGAGDDTYNVSTGDVVVENANEGTDTVLSDVSWTLGANVENLTLTGTDAIHAIGNSLNNSLTGNSAANLLIGGAGDDTYNVSTGDTVVEQANEGTDTVLSDVSWTLGANVENLTLTGTGAINGTGNSLNNSFTGNSAANVFTGGAGDDTYNVSTGDVVVEAANEGIDTVQSDVSWTLGANVENLTLTGTGAIDGTGNSLNNSFTGNSAANVFTGGAGDDTYNVSTGDVVVEAANEGIDTVQSDVSWTLGANVENLTLTGTGAIDGTGNSLNNSFTGNSAANVFTGGAGDDTYNVSTGDVVVENANEGTDLVQSDVSWTLGANVENLTLTGTGAIDGTGNSLNNSFTGNSAANVFTGGAGDDTYNVSTGDVVVEAANEGIDTVQSDVSWTLGANVENLTLTGTGAIDGTGNSLNNSFTGNSAANVFTGGAGDDTYNVSTGDVVVEAANEGTDTVQSDVSWTLGANVENLTLTGTGAIDGTGNSLNNSFTGNSAANVFTGGAGDDTYNVSTGDVVVEAANEGTDTVQSDVSWTLGANVENLTLTGTGAIDGTGNSLNNSFTGNSAANVFTGGAGDDTYNVSTGDVVVEAANEGIDTVQSDVSWTLGANVENLTLTGTGAIDGTGNSLNNILTGNSAANVFTGGAGDDTYNVSTGDVVVENANEGTDLVQSDVSWTLGANVENLTLTGTGAIDGTGNSLNNILTGNSAANVFTGGAGDDTYNVSTGDVVVEAANEGIDTVQSDVSWTLGANVENLTLTGTAAIDGTGNSLNNILTGNSAANVFTGGAGDDTYNVSTGDVVVEAANEGIDTVQGDVSWTLGANVENLTLTGTGAIDGTGNSLNNILTGNSAANVFTGGAGDDTYNVSTGDVVVEAANEGIDTVQSDVSWTLGANVENLTLTGTAAIDGTGNSLNNSFTGNSAANVFTGGAGDDTYNVSTGDVVVEAANEGIDTVQSDVSWTLGANVENLTLTGTAAIDGTGNSLNNSFTGNSAANVFTGGAGDDTYNVSTGDVVVEAANEGIDTVQSDVSWTLGANVENLTLTGTGAIDGTGNSLNNSFTGNSAANVFTGGAGDDTYNVSTGDVVVEAANEGIDTVQSDVSWTLGANVENLTLTGTAAIDGTGNSLNNSFTGNSAANVFTGGAGDDTYVVGAGDTVVEAANEGIDTVQSDVSWTLGANVENLTLTGTAAIDGTGNSLNNILTGNSAANVFTGGAGDDTYVVGAGDTVVEAANEGTDLVKSSASFTLGANVENLTLTGTAAINGTGNSLNNTLTGNGGANVLTGGAGNDTYVVGAGDTVVEAANEGTDLVLSSASFTLGANVENLTLTGTAAINGTGNSLNNTLTGNGGANVLTGGAGNDTYVVGAGDTVVEAANEGTDLVLSSASFTLGANVENLTLTGTAAINGTGNSLNNTLTGNGGANVLTGGAGNDTYVVGAGDTVVEAANEGTDLVLSSASFTLGANVENLTLTGTAAINGTGNSLNNTLTGNSGANVLTGGAGNDTYVVGAGDTVVEAANEGTDLVLSSASFTLGANVENLTLTGTAAINGTGNSLNNTLTGNGGANVLTGGAGNDTYVVGAGDTVVEAANEGTDLVLSSASFTLGANVENLTLTGTAAINGTGNSLNNTLTGNSGANVLTGGAGNDTYVVGAGDTVVEAANEGTDLVLSSASFTLGANVENLTLTGTAAINGTGNSLNNTLTGNGGANVLTGGAGNDTYVVGAGDTVVEAANEGTDLVLSSASFTLGANVENLTLTGTAAINGTGNSLNNTLRGNSGANVLTGGAGSDTYYVGLGDTVVEQANEGTDLVVSDVTWTLGANVEKLTLTGTAAINGTGNSLNNTLTGNSGANVLTGGAGNDTLAGGLGNDTYRVDRGEGQDTISENDGTVGNSDVLLYGATINPLDVVLSRQVNDLRLAIHGSTDSVTVQNWFSTPTTAQVETIQAGNGQTLLSTQVDQLIQAMASFSQQTGLTWDQAIDQQPQNVQTVLAASWQ